MLLMIYIPIREKVEPTRAFFTLMHGLSTHSSFVKGQAFSEVTKNYPTVCTCQQRRKIYSACSPQSVSIFAICNDPHTSIETNHFYNVPLSFQEN